MGLDVLAIRRQIRRLETVYSAPGSDTDHVVRGWQEVLGERVSETELADAVLEYMRSDARWWPKPGQLLRLIEADRSRHYDDQGSSAWAEGDGPCPVCGATLQLLTAAQMGMAAASPDAPKRYGVLHDARAHRIARVPAWGAWR